MIVLWPIPTKLTLLPTIVATAVFEELKLQLPGLVDTGVARFSEATLSLAMVRFENEPSVGFSAVIVTVVDAVALFQLEVAFCVAVTVKVPASKRVMVLPLRVAIACPATVLLEIAYDQPPLEGEVGGVSVSVWLASATLLGSQAPRGGVPGVTISTAIRELLVNVPDGFCVKVI